MRYWMIRNLSLVFCFAFESAHASKTLFSPEIHYHTATRLTVFLGFFIVVLTPCDVASPISFKLECFSVMSFKLIRLPAHNNANIKR